MVKNLAFVLRIFIAYAVLSVGCFLMLRTIVGYTSFRDDVQFLALKQDYVHNVVWKTAFYIHVFSAVAALLAGFTQFSPQLLRENPKVHRLIGKIYVANILFINFPVGLIMIVLLGLELVTGSFALVPLPFLQGEATAGAVVTNCSWVFIGNLIGSVAYGALIAIALTDMGAIAPSGVASRIIAAAEAKTTGYAAFGFAGLVTVFVKGILCNWMVCLAVVLAMSTTSTIGKIATAWMPVFVFFAQGFEHSVVNMFIIPTGMMLGAKVTVADWWLWNQIPVTLGNLVGGFCFTGFALYWTYKPATAPATEETHIPATVPAE